jgi:putative hemolysin
MAQYANGRDALQPVAHQYATKSVATVALNATNLFRYTGSVLIVAIIGRVTTGIQNQATSVKLQVLADSLAAYDACAALNIQAFAAGSLLSITGTAANAMAGTTAVGAFAPGQANPVVVTCVTSGYIAQHSTAASTGAITWEVLWQPLSAGATVTPV